ncbi:MAG: hypothetical protein KDK36_02195 [Leptospiraceae bacterium]|nr:hypothetical protein [Leptospiraceae bacterium]
MSDFLSDHFENMESQKILYNSLKVKGFESILGNENILSMTIQILIIKDKLDNLNLELNKITNQEKFKTTDIMYRKYYQKIDYFLDGSNEIETSINCIHLFESLYYYSWDLFKVKNRLFEETIQFNQRFQSKIKIEYPLNFDTTMGLWQHLTDDGFLKIMFEERDKVYFQLNNFKEQNINIFPESFKECLWLLENTYKVMLEKNVKRR